MTDLRLSKARKVPYTILEMNSVYPSFQTFVEILVHEMIHHYQWTVDKYPQSQCEHGRSNFFCWKPKLAKHNLKLYEGFKEVIIKHER